MNGTPTEWTLKGFCSHFGLVDNKMPDYAFAWVLGAGASKPSGIPTGGELVTLWLKELHERLDRDNLPFEQWATATNLGIEGFKLQNAASFYPRVYERRFRDHPDEGYAYLEDLMSGKDPSPGYSILAKTMETRRHKVVITTNFDDLVAVAMVIHTGAFPFVCGHESLTGFIRATMRRPLVCKIHRDLLLGPKNDPRSVVRLHEAWAGTLRSLFAHYTPIFIGYGGNDDSLMDLLMSLDPKEIKGQMIWCYYEKGEEPSKRISDLVAQHHGALVPVPDFDRLMVLLGVEMGIKLVDDEFEQRAKARAAKYQERILALATTSYPDVATALATTFERPADRRAWELKARTASEWTLKGFCSHFGLVDNKMPDYAFAWVLGAGASKPSGIPTGGELVTLWLKELHERLDRDNLPFEQWATATNLGIEGFKLQYAASFYPRVYERRFRDHPDEGYAFIEDLISWREPSLGYSILATTMETRRHKVVITTNFDNLVADALSIYTNTFPFVGGHESPIGLVRAAMRRPLVYKIHRDLLLGPKNDPGSVRRLHEAWAGTLRALLAHYTPIFIGYGGNDDSLMDLLESLDPGEIKGQMIWCYYEQRENPGKRITELVAQHRGVLVPVPDFDVLMVLLGAEMEIKPLDYLLEERSKKRITTYKERILALQKSDYPNVNAALVGTFEQAGDWWTWELKAQAELDSGKREAIYRQGIQQVANSWELHGNFANFMADIQKNPDEAERLYRKALELDPHAAIPTGNFANFMANIRKNPDEAERLYRKALDLDPHDVNNTGNFAHFMADIRKNPDEVERLYRKALELDPHDVNNTGNFAVFMADVRKNPDEAERLYRKALDLDPHHAINTGNFAVFMADIRKNPDEAEQLYRKALNLNPHAVSITGNFGGFLVAQGRMDEAVPLLQRAWTLDLSKPDQSSAEVALYTGIIERCAGLDDNQALSRLKTMFLAGFNRLPWSFDAVLAFAKAKLSMEDLALYSALAEAILDADRITTLDTFERWRSVAPVPLDQPWEINAG